VIRKLKHRGSGNVRFNVLTASTVLGFDAVYFGKEVSVFQRNIGLLPPFWGETTCHSEDRHPNVSEERTIFSLALKMEAVLSSETFVPTCQSTLRKSYSAGP
jgi:hypothetical protein